MSMGAWDGRHKLDYGLWGILCLRMSPFGGPMSLMGDSMEVSIHTGIPGQGQSYPYACRMYGLWGMLCLPYVAKWRSHVPYGG